MKVIFETYYSTETSLILLLYHFSVFKRQNKGVSILLHEKQISWKPSGTQLWYSFSRRCRPSKQIRFLWLLHLLVKFGCPNFRNHKADRTLLPRRERFKIKLPKSCACISLQLLGGPVNTSALQKQELPMLIQGRTSTDTSPLLSTPATV